jgi:hypothetical protein
VTGRLWARRQSSAHTPGHAGLEHRRPGVFADIGDHLEVAESATALGMRLPLRGAFPVDLGHLLDQVMILQQDRAVGAERQRVLVTWGGGARIRRRVTVGHLPTS